MCRRNKRIFKRQEFVKDKFNFYVMVKYMNIKEKTKGEDSLLE